MREPFCEICETHHHPRQAHRFGPAINNVTPAAPAINIAINERTPNRRSREKYNGYMRDYMRAYRKRSK